METVEGTERISSPRSDSAMIRLATSEAARLRLSLRASAPYKMSDIGAQRKKASIKKDSTIRGFDTISNLHMLLYANNLVV